MAGRRTFRGPELLSRLLACCALACCAPAPSRAAAQAMDTFGMGSRSTSLAGAVTADVSDFSAGFYNPAGLARDGLLELSVGYLRAWPDLAIDGRDSRVDPVAGTVFGLVVPGEIGGLRFAFGLSGHLPDARVSRTRSLPRQQVRWEMYDNRPHRTFLGANVAVRLWDFLLVGGGLSFMATSENDLGARGTLDVPSPESASRVEHEVRFDLETIRYPQAGFQIIADETLSFGAVYRGEYALGSLLTAEVVAGITGLGDPIPAYLFLETESINTFNPRQVSVGASWAPTERVRVGVELTWVDWSAYRSPIGRSDVILTIDVPPDLSDLISVPDSIDSTDFIAARFEDRFVPRVGVEVLPIVEETYEISARAGYAYESTPVPPQTGLTNLVDSDHHVLALGAGIRFDALDPVVSGGVRLDAHVQWTIVPERVTRKASLVDGAGDYRGSGSIPALGATLTVEFE